MTRSAALQPPVIVILFTKDVNSRNLGKERGKRQILTGWQKLTKKGREGGTPSFPEGIFLRFGDS